jgi:hypothetical protein
MKIKVLRLDNGGEYTSNDFKDFCKEAGIKRELTSLIQPSTEWGCREKESVHHRFFQGYDT